MFSFLALAVIESVHHSLKDKHLHDASYMRKHAQVYQVEHCKYPLKCSFANQMAFEDCCLTQKKSVSSIGKNSEGSNPVSEGVTDCGN